MSTWILIFMTYYGGVEHVEFNSQKACIEAREVVKRNTPTSWSLYTMCVKK